MGYVVALVAIVVVIGYLIAQAQRATGEGDRPTAVPKASTGKPRLTSRRKLRELVNSEHFDTLTDWEKQFCTDVNQQRTGLTYKQADKIDEIWSSLEMHKHYLAECKAASERLEQIMKSPAFDTLPDKEKKYMQRVYGEGDVSGSYRIRRIQEVHGKLFAKE
jgi:hypothetical protein